ncbi:MAG: type II toxin-antitoxin system HicB family antitoxin [Candidatus Magnetobacterium sp. LHC-1]|uniref:type II toxin-antitoxin system HicB family antitoxin n=1 Tax=Candidatus Magnetobacterium casense TaxID=1455061 RepID=UPI001C4547EF|nr:hypothetical protein [Candidatus Magnetobacterium casensis]
MTIETEQEEDGRWIAEVPDIAGALVYGDTRNEAIVHVKALALRIMADRSVAYDTKKERGGSAPLQNPLQGDQSP